MVCLCWLFLVVMTFVCVPGFRSMCLDNSICQDLNTREQILDCVQLCISEIQSEIPDLDASVLPVNDKDNNDYHYDDGDLLLKIILATLASEDEISESALTAHSDNRRSYSMEHFRWGKPSGRKRRPVKVFASSLEGGSSSESSFPFRARRHLGSDKAEGKKGAHEGSAQNQGSQRSRSSSRASRPPGLQERKDATYRMTHFRWSSPHSSKRNKRNKKLWEEKPQRQLPEFLKDTVEKNVRRITK
ncbi:pro-opiomelanocortin-like [Cololabis saira]|uniref:pro-opiomelanocortin-like n=1 Tax=Cololabis saira TaxID=129043 RepID=UPI002AD291FA|nr:pro-opiomelanocortin-like [Cololabis saira]